MFRNLLRGRYGVDNFTLTLLVISLVFSRFKYIGLLGYILMGYAVYRTLSKDFIGRRRELQKFNMIIGKIKGFFFKRKHRFEQRKLYVFLPCPNCKKSLRLPRDKGKLSVTCPSCSHRFLKKT